MDEFIGRDVKISDSFVNLKLAGKWGIVVGYDREKFGNDFVIVNIDGTDYGFFSDEVFID